MREKRLNLDLVKEGAVREELLAFFRPGLPEKILQFGEGNFLRGFLDWMIHRLNGRGLFEGGIIAVQPTPHGKVVPKLNAQDGLYTLVLRGLEEGKTVERREIVASIRRGINPYTDWEAVLEAAANPDIRFVFSNTTEAGIRYVPEPFVSDRAPSTFPAQLAACLYHRYQKLQGAPEAGWYIIPCELIDENGRMLKDIVLRISRDWGFPDHFLEWVNRHHHFCVTLVDRIVTGYPSDEAERFGSELGYEDELLTVGEPYHLLVIDGPSDLPRLLPFHEAGLNVRWEPVQKYRELKVRILNGAHTLMCFPALLSGRQTVKEVMDDPEMRSFVSRAIDEEILPTLDIGEEEKQAFARSVLERFSNPFVKHRLTDIALNSIAKFKARLLPTLLAYERKTGELPSRILFSLSAMLLFYKENAVPPRDNEEAVLWMKEVWKAGGSGEAVKTILQNRNLWGEDLTRINGLAERVAEMVSAISKEGPVFGGK